MNHKPYISRPPGFPIRSAALAPSTPLRPPRQRLQSQQLLVAERLGRARRLEGPGVAAQREPPAARLAFAFARGRDVRAAVGGLVGVGGFVGLVWPGLRGGGEEAEGGVALRRPPVCQSGQGALSAF